MGWWNAHGISIYTVETFIMFEVATKTDLPDVAPPAVAYVRDEADYYWCFWTGWRKVDNAFPVNAETEIPTKALYTLANDRSLTYRQILDYHYAWRNAPLMEVSVPTGKIAFSSGRMYAIQDQSTPVEWMGRTFQQMGVPILEEGTPGIHIQDRAVRKSLSGFYDAETGLGAYHNEPIGFVVCKGAIKGATSIECSVTPPSVATKVNTPSKQVTLTSVPEDATMPMPCVGGVENSNVPWPYTNEMWLTGPWEYVDINLSSVEVHPGGWPEGLTRTLTFADPIPMPVVAGGCGYLGQADMYINPHIPGFAWQVIGDYGKTIGATSITVRVGVEASEKTLWVHNAGTTTIELFQPWWMLHGGQRRNSNLRGLANGDYVAFARTTKHDPNNPTVDPPLDRTLYRVSNVEANPLGNPSRFTITPGLKYPLLDESDLPFSQYKTANDCYWIATAAAREGQVDPLVFRCTGWTDPYGKRGVPIFVKEVHGNTIELLCPLPADIPANTKMYMWSAIDNETMTYAYHDPYSYAYNRALVKQKENIQPEVDAWNAYIRSEIDRYQRLRAKAVVAAEKKWFTPPYFENTNLNDVLPPGQTFHDIFETLNAQLIDIEIPRENQAESERDLEYISLLNYRSIL